MTSSPSRRITPLDCSDRRNAAAPRNTAETPAATARRDFVRLDLLRLFSDEAQKTAAVFKNLLMISALWLF